MRGRTYRLPLTVLAGISLSVVLSACGRQGQEPSRANTTASPSAGATASAAASSAFRRIVSLSPNVTEIVFALGQGHRVVGVSSYCNWPAEANRLPRCGGPMDTDLERILTLRPDLVIIHGQQDNVIRFCEQNRIVCHRIAPNDMAQLYEAVLSVGEKLGCRDQSELLVARMKADLERVRLAVRGRPPVRTYLSLSRSPDQLKGLMTTNGRGFVSEMLEAAGGVNIFADSAMRYPSINTGEILRRQPEAIIELEPGTTISPSQRTRMIAQWAELGTIPAVANNRIHFITDDYVMIPGPRVPLLAKRFAEILHPDLAGQLNAPSRSR